MHDKVNVQCIYSQQITVCVFRLYSADFVSMKFLLHRRRKKISMFRKSIEQIVREVAEGKICVPN